MTLTRPYPRDVLLAIAGIAHRTRSESGGLSFLDAIDETPYLEIRSDLCAADLIPILRERPDLVSAWWNWSYDKRCSPSWYILHESRTVGYYPGGPELKFDTLEEAVAEFMVRDLAQSADHLIAWKNRKKRGR